MFNDFMGKRITIIISSRGENLLEYTGVLSSEDEKYIVLTDVSISYLMLNFQKGIFGNNINKYKESIDKIIVNKKYIISYGDYE